MNMLLFLMHTTTDVCHIIVSCLSRTTRSPFCVSSTDLSAFYFCAHSALNDMQYPLSVTHFQSFDTEVCYDLPHDLFYIITLVNFYHSKIKTKFSSNNSFSALVRVRKSATHYINFFAVMLPLLTGRKLVKFTQVCLHNFFRSHKTYKQQWLLD